MNTHLFYPLTRCVVTLCLSVGVASAAQPKGWQFIGEFESGDKQYIDMSALKKERGYVRVRTMINYKRSVWSVTSKRIFSETGTDYVDCKGRRFMILEAASYECPMASCQAKENSSYPFDEKEFKAISSMQSRVGNVYDLVCQQ